MVKLPLAFLKMQKQIKQVPANDSFGVLTALQSALDGEIVLFVTGPEVNGVKPIVDLSNIELDPETVLIVESSGSTGIPKRIQISKSALLYSAEKSLEVLGGPGQFLLCLPLTFIAGMQVLTRSLVSDLQPVLMNTQMPFTVEAFVRGASLLEGPRKYTSLVPTQLKRLADEIDADAFLYSTLRKFDAILVGGQKPDLNVVLKLRSMGINIVITYGMTETCGGCVYDSVPLPGVSIEIVEGRIQISGPVLAKGLGKSFLTQDLGQLVSGKLEVLGRADRVIASGGIKVSLDSVEEILGQIPGVQEVVAVAISDPEWGERVGIAFTGSPEVEVARHLEYSLGPAAKPVVVSHFADLPRLHTGKPDRLTVAQLLGNSI